MNARETREENNEIQECYERVYSERVSVMKIPVGGATGRMERWLGHVMMRKGEMGTCAICRRERERVEATVRKT